MGADLFERFADVVAVADAVLGYSIRQLCVNDPQGVLSETQFTQPALFVVNALTCLHTVETRGRPAFVAGHSLGEYNALLAAEAIDFETGLRLVQKRGELMGKVKGGGMAAVVGLAERDVARVLSDSGCHGVDIANRNAPSQFVISGPVDEIRTARAAFESAGAKLFIPLRVSAPFHSRHMAEAQSEFMRALDAARFAPPTIPVISNVEAKPYPESRIRDVLSRQITSPVCWTETIQYLTAVGETDFVEVGPGRVLTGLVEKIRREPVVHANGARQPVSPAPVAVVVPPPVQARRSAVAAERLGSAAFRKHYGVRYAYVAGAMYQGIASRQLVVRMGRAGLLAFLGTGGMPVEAIAADVRFIRSALPRGEPWGANLLANLALPKLEEDTVDLFLQEGVRHVEAAAFLMITPALVRYRLRGIHVDENGQVIAANSILAKTSRPEVAEAFMSPPPDQIVEKLLESGVITRQEAELAPRIPMAGDVCVECDASHTDQGTPFVLLPAMRLLRDRIMARHGFPVRIRIGMGGGIGSPEAVAAALILGADFILTGSINQCTVEAGTSDAVKDMLQDMDVQHTEYAPAGDMFELGVRVPVLRRGVLFPARANKLYDLYRNHDAIDAIDEATRRQIQEKYFHKTFEDVWQEICDHYRSTKPDEIEKAERNPKHRMGLIFRWYFLHTMRLALEGRAGSTVDYQIRTSPALGAFNRWVKGTDLEPWRNRHVDAIAETLMQETARILDSRIHDLQESWAAEPARES